MSIKYGGNSPKKIAMRTPSRLPAEYQEVEYIESSGTQYLAPGVAHSAGDTIKVEADIYIKGNGAIYSQYTSWTPVYNIFQLGIDNGAFFARMNANSGGLSTTWTPSTYTVNTRYNVVAEGQTSINQKAPYLLANNDANGVGWYMSAKLYSFKIRKNGTLERDLVPCYRIADTVIGMYDLVNDTFYTNAGSGTFTKGNDVNLTEKEIKRVTIRPNGTEKQIRPDGVIEEIVPVANTWNNIYKSGYKIKKVIMEAYYNNNSTGVCQFKIYQTNGGKDIGIVMPFGGNRGSWAYPYGAIYKDNPSVTTVVSFNNSWTTSTKWAIRATFNENDGYLQVGQEMNNWIYEGAFTYTSDVQDTITTIFNSTTPKSYFWGGNIGDVQGEKLTITYIQAS